MRVYETVAGAGREGAGGRSSDRRWVTAVGHRLVAARSLVAAGRSACWALPDRQPAGPAARPLRPVLAGARRRAGAGARWWRGRWPPTPTARSPPGKRLAALADAAERAPRIGPRGRRERAVGGAGAGRSRRRCRWRWSPNWPTPRPACCWPGDSTTTPSATPWRCASARWCAGCGSAEPRRMPTYFEIAERGTLEMPVGAGEPPHVGAGRAARRGRLRAAVLRVGPGRRGGYARRAGGSPSAAPFSRGAAGRGRRRANSPRRPDCGSARPT